MPAEEWGFYALFQMGGISLQTEVENPGVVEV